MQIQFFPKNYQKQSGYFGSRSILGVWITAEQAAIPVDITTKKSYLFKIYDSLGNFITTWRDVVNEPTFSIDINGGFSELTLDLARPENNFDEGVSVDYGNHIKIYVFDRDSGYSGVLIYSGELTRYVPKIIGAQELVTVTFLSYWLQTNQFVLEDASKTTVSYVGVDPTNILKDVLDKFTAAGGRLDYSGGSTDDTGTTVTYDFNTATYQEVLKKILELSPADWFLRVGADDIVYFQQKSATADHKLTLGKQISEFIPEKRIENIINTIYFSGGGSPKLYKKYTSAGSVTAYGTRSIKYVDNNVLLSGTSDKIKTRIFDALDGPEVRVTLRVMDNNGNAEVLEKGYDIESFKVGDTVQIFNATSKAGNYWDIAEWDTDAWDYDITNAQGTPLQIMKITYTPDYVNIELSNRQPDVIARIEEINRAFIASQTSDNPTTPS